MIVAHTHSLRECRVSSLPAALALIAFASAALAQGAIDATASLSGRVVDVLGEPIPAANVYVDSSPAGLRLATGKTDGSGFFIVARLPRDDFARITVRAPGFVSEPTWAGRLQAHGSLASDLVMLPAGKIGGVVVDATGKAVAFACVHASAPFGRNRAQTETTADAEGRFVLEDAPLGEVLLMTWQRGFVLDERRLFCRGDTGERIVLSDQGLSNQGASKLAVTVTGLVDEADRSTVRLRLERFVDNWSQPLPSALGHCSLDGNSKCTVEGLLPGKYQMIVVSPRISVGASAGSRDAQLTVGRGQVQEVTFAAAVPGGVKITGMLRGQDGTALAGKELAFSSSNGVRIQGVRTDAQGSFSTIASLTEGEKLWPSLAQDGRLAITDASMEAIAVRGAQLDLHLVACECTELRGRVLDQQLRGQPGARVALTAIYQGYGNSIIISPERNEVAASRADANGQFVLRWYQGSAKLSDLRIEAMDPRGGAVQDLTGVGEGEAVELRLRPSNGVAGCVRDAAGKPVGGVRVLITNLAEDNRASQRGGVEVCTDRLGFYRLASLREGEYRIDVTLRGQTVLKSLSPVAIKAGECRTGIDFVVDP
ncbi:MAG: carboxypeptidase regulatory-like domain-containing protein [Planctomycetes bacterium]|nr:carboxypeptidase regulatory-like domain-containing protein [Planctomycetota bacterium]